MRAILSAGVCFLLLSGCRGRDEAAVTAASPASVERRNGTIVFPPDSPKLRELRVEAVRSAQVPRDEVTSPGKIDLNPNRVSHVVLPVPGRISSVLVHLGDPVEQGQVLLTVESPDADAAESAYLQSLAAVTQARAGQVKAQADFDRASDLFSHDAIAEKEVISAKNSLAQALAAVEQALALREQAIRRLGMLGLKPGVFGQKVAVRAPLAGKVLEINVAAGEYRNDTTAPLLTVADLSTVWVAADVPEISIRLIRLNEPVDISLAAFPGETFRGHVARIADTVDPQTRTIKVRAEMENPQGRFRPEMFGNIRYTSGSQLLPVVPPGAIIQGDGKTVVYREMAPGQFQQTQITAGQRSGSLIPILSGLRSGDRVVVDGAMLLKGQ